MSMLVWLVPVCAAAILLLVGSTRPVFFAPRTYAEAAAGLLIASFPFIVVAPFSVGTRLLICVLQAWALLLPARIIFGRLSKEFVYPSTVRGAWLFLAASASVPVVSVALLVLPVTIHTRWLLGMVAVIAAEAFFFANCLWALWHYRLRLKGTHRRQNELPTVSVCIPARNETHALEDCLVSVLESTYPKMEVLVLDDCSQDATSQIIRSFAHDGVRFVQGEQPAEGWLGKNQALQTLAAQADGEVLLFADVDTRLAPDSIMQLINYAMDNNAQMVTVLPQNRLGLRPGSLGGTLRAFWQLVLPLTARHVPVASQLWLIRASTLKALGGFEGVAQKIVPESSFATRIAAENTYRFVASNRQLGVTTAKRWPSVLESAVRLLYPTFKRQPFYTLLGAAGILAVFAVPFTLVVRLAVAGQISTLFYFALVATLLGMVTFGLVLRRTHPRVWWLAMLLLPIVAVQEVVLLVVSMLQYEFGEVNWKGRNVCYPVILSAQTRAANWGARRRR